MQQSHVKLTWHSCCTHLAVGDIAGYVPNGKDAQQAVVIPPWVVDNPAGGLKPTSRPQPVPYPGGLLLWAVEAVLAVEDSGLICLAKPGDEKRDLQGRRQALNLLSQSFVEMTRTGNLLSRNVTCMRVAETMPSQGMIGTTCRRDFLSQGGSAE